MNAIIYARFSPRPNEELCESVDKQIERCRAWASAMGHSVDESAIFPDEASSGATADDRPVLQSALTRTRLDKGILIVTAIDRLGRSTIDILRISASLTDAGAAWASLTQSIDTTNPAGRFMVAVFAAMAQMEREQIADRTRIGMRRLQAQGWAVSKRLKVGFRISAEQPADRNQRGIPRKALKTEADAEELAVLERAKSLRLLNYSYRAIAETLNGEGRIFRGGPWTHITIYRHLKSNG